MNDLEKRQLRDVLGAFVTGVTVVTTIDAEGRPHGVTANSFSSVSLDPPLVLWSQALTAKSFPAFRDAERFAVNILSDEQVDISNRFAKSGEDKFGGVAISTGLGGVPIIDGCAALLECSRVDIYPGGDHAVFLGRVERFTRTPSKPLAFGGGKYMLAYAHDLGPVSVDLGMATLAHLKGVRVATALLPEICEQIGFTLALAVWGNKGPTIISWAPSRTPVSENLRTGLVVDLLQSATGRAFAAFMPPAITDELIAAELASTVMPSYCTSVEYAALLDEYRRHGLARAALPSHSSIHNVSVTALSAPVFDAEGMMVCALTGTGRADEVDPDWSAPVPVALARAAAALSRKFGYRAGGPKLAAA